jgi:hypothetical protein
MEHIDPEMDHITAHAAARRRRVALVAAAAIVVLVAVAGLHAFGVLPPGG